MKTTRQKAKYSDIMRMTDAIEAEGWNWLIRSNKAAGDVGGPYFANITHGIAVLGNGMTNPAFKSFPAYGDTAEAALQNSYNLFITVNTRGSA